MMQPEKYAGLALLSTPEQNLKAATKPPAHRVSVQEVIANIYIWTPSKVP